jgi:DNA-binding MarR family transcriptional regulator
LSSPPPEAAAFAFFNEIGIINQLASTQFERVMPAGLSLAGFSVLNHFVRLNKKAEAPAKLARAFQVTKGAMTNTLQRLEAQGWVLVAADPEDGRAKLVSITPAGRKTRDAAIAALAPVFAEFFAKLDPKLLAQALPTLARVRETLDQAREV